MDKNIGKTVKSTQEQAVASWINYLNQVRLNELLQKLLQQDNNLENALEELDMLKRSIAGVIQSNRGGTKGMHGFIAERMQVYIENARSLVEGVDREYYLIDDNGPVDYIRKGINYQQKFVQKHLSLDAIEAHLDKYPDYIKNGGKYQIPKDFYSKIKYLYEMSETEAKKLQGEEYRLWQYIQSFFKNKEIRFADLESTVVNYGDVQSGKATETIGKERENILRKDQEERAQFYQKSKPSFHEGVKVAGVSAVAEGGVAFCMGVYKKRKAGKKLSEFNSDDWKEVGVDTAKGLGKGGVRGTAVYGMTNFTATPAAVATALVTATFGMAVEADKLRKGEIDQETFLINSEILSLDVTVSAISSILGEVIIPVPVLGAVIGNVAGMFMYNIAKEIMSKKEQQLILQHNQNMKELSRSLDGRYAIVCGKLDAEFKKYNSLVELAFDADVNKAFMGSVRLAEYTGVPKDKILRSEKDIANYFLM